MSNILGAVSASFDLLKKALEVKSELNRAEDRELVILAKEALLDVKEKMLELRSENLSLQSKLSIKAAYVLDQAVYWKSKDDLRHRPYCPNCMSNGIERPMSPSKQGTNVTYFYCPNKECSFGRNLNGYEPPMVHSVGGSIYPTEF